MFSNNEMYRPGITLVSDDQVLDAVAGGVDIGDAVTSNYTLVKTVGIAISVVKAAYWYGDPANRDKVHRVCKQIAAGFTNASRDAIYLGIAAETTVSSWIRTYFSTAATKDSAATSAEVCVSPV